MTSSMVAHDLLIVGGGINGCGIAADAAGRGLEVVLCEMNDLGSATSSASTKLIHGGLRYLEQYEFRLVREALAEREVLLRKAPHIIWPMRFQLPHRKHLRPRWMIRAGLYLYDFLSQRVTLPRSCAVTFDSNSPLVAEMKRGFEYSDAWVDDARLVVLNAMQARANGAQILTRTECIGLESIADGDSRIWKATLLDRQSRIEKTVFARALINATGPWVGQFANRLLRQSNSHNVRMVKGCHIIVPRLYEQSEAFLLQNSDGRVVFVIPYENDYTLIGTTEEDFTGNPSDAEISAWEIDYLVNLVNECFRTKIGRDMVVHHFAGVRPLIESEEANASKVSRDYTLELDRQQAPVLTIYGGKITTYRKLAEAALDKLRVVFPHMPKEWTISASLPGGNFNTQSELQESLVDKYPWLSDAIVQRWTRQYGSLAYTIAGNLRSLDEMGQHFGHGLYAREVDYLSDNEWAMDTDDVLWRRTKLGLRFNAEQVTALGMYLEARNKQWHG